ncbi:MAG: glutamine--fructose-6-phosphate transaminase (isomerizing) [bacterium]|nr:glutamine--fructose-6-phosphate transaminase (isomerizing) [bacterium]
MCGIVGYLGKDDVISVIISGLKRLEYRGYDSCGFSVYDKKGQDLTLKTVGRVAALEKMAESLDFEAVCGIGHSRWATHGLVTEKNAHPHFDCKKEIFLVHNGIIENYKEIKKKLLERGHKFVSDTDTEVLVHLIEEFFKGNLEEAVHRALKYIKGAYAIAVISKKDPGKIVVARKSSPLVFSVEKNRAIVASDPTPILPFSDKVVFLEDDELAVLTPEGFKVFDFEKKQKIREPQVLDWTIEESEKGGFSHFMLKEIFEEPEAVENSIRGRIVLDEGIAKLGGLEMVSDKLSKIDRLILVACGTASYACMVGEYMIEENAEIPVEVDVASEFRYRNPILDKKTAFLAVSQSGETADTLAALREAKRKGLLSLGVVNMVGSSITRETEAGVYNHIGPEIAVAATKSFISQLSILALLTVFLGRQRNMSLSKGQEILGALKKLPDLMRETLKENDEKMKNLAEKYSKYRNFIFLGRKYNYPVALEGALKLKEIAFYIHAEGFPTGEIKHGPIALADENLPFFFIAPKDSVYDKVVSNMEEVRARKAPIIAITTKGNSELEKIADDVIYVPQTIEMLMPILNTIPLHLFAYYMGNILGCDVDKPRNLAKSVTVE